MQAAADYYCTDLYVLTEKPERKQCHWIRYKASTTNQMTRKTIVTEHLPIYSWRTAPLFILM